MEKILQIISQLSWMLGLLSILSGFLIKLIHLEGKLTIASHTAFLLAGTFFLCALATRAIQRPA